MIPPKRDAEFVHRMEDILDVYRLPYDPKRPVVCFDEKTKQLINHVKEPIKAKKGNQPKKVDYHYERNGTTNIFMFAEPFAGRREVKLFDTKTGLDFAEAMRYLVEDLYPEAEKIVLVLDNLSTHKLKFLYEKFQPARARKIANTLELHYTPVNASWLNIAEIELSVLERMCLNRRIGTKSELNKEIQTLCEIRNKQSKEVDWRFTTEDARIRLKYFYPKI